MSDLARLSAFPFVDELSPRGKQCLSRALSVQRVPRRTTLIRQGDEVSGAYLVCDGSLRVFCISPGGREGTLYMVDPGESCILALNCTFSGVRYPAWVESGARASTVALIPASTFRDLFTVEPALQSFTFEVLAGRLFDLMTRLEETLACDVGQRLASLLLRSCDRTGTVTMTQDRAAGHLGTAREVVTRLLRRLEADGLVETGRGRIQILDVAALRERGPQHPPD